VNARRSPEEVRLAHLFNQIANRTAAGQIAEGGDDVARFVAGRRSDGGEPGSQPAEQHGSET